jgi:hypothetical protein
MVRPTKKDKIVHSHFTLFPPSQNLPFLNTIDLFGRNLAIFIASHLPATTSRLKYLREQWHICWVSNPPLLLFPSSFHSSSLYFSVQVIDLVPSITSATTFCIPSGSLTFFRWSVAAPGNGTTSERRGQKMPPILSFTDPQEFRAIHENATKAEFKIQQKRVDTFNKRNPEFEAWVITAPPVGQSWMPYIFRIRLNSQLPKGVELPGIGQSLKLRIVNAEKNHSSWYPC